MHLAQVTSYVRLSKINILELNLESIKVVTLTFHSEYTLHTSFHIGVHLTCTLTLILPVTCQYHLLYFQSPYFCFFFHHT